MEWIKCSERMPEQNKSVLIFCDKGNGDDARIMIAYWYDCDKEIVWLCSCHMNCYCNQTDPIRPTHWMPLPQPPK